MDEQSIINSLSTHSVVGAGVAAALAFVYKLWRLLKTDRKEDDLDSAERSLREELRLEIVRLKDEIVNLKEEVRELNVRNEEYIKINAQLRVRIQWLETCFQHCKLNHPPDCPLLKHLGEEKFNKLGD